MMSPWQQCGPTKGMSRPILCSLTHGPRDTTDRAKRITHVWNSIDCRNLKHLALESRAPADPSLLAVVLEMTYAHTAKFRTRQTPQQTADVCN